MRQVEQPQRQLGQVDITRIELDLRSRDDIPQLLRGLQYIYATPALRDEVFQILRQVIPQDDEGKPVSADNGRPGMEQWKILVLGVLRLGLNTDYDRLQEIANQHRTVRQFLGHSDWYDEEHYGLQCLRDNLRLFTPEILNQISQAVVSAGHVLVIKGPNAGPTEPELLARCDSFVVETHVHYPTDINLLFDAVRKLLQEGQRLAQLLDLTGWRQAKHHIQVFKRQYRLLQKTRRQANPDPEVLEQTTICYLSLALDHLARAETLRAQCVTSSRLPALTQDLDQWLGYGRLLVDQIDRRCLMGETIPHEEKIFSIFQPHTEWISKGKAGVPVELGLRVHIVEDQYRFLLHHQVARRQTDEQLALRIARETKACFPGLEGMSFDKGYHSPENQRELPHLVPQVTLPKKGRLNAKEQEREQSPQFQLHRRRHSAVESAINALEQGGLDRCPDHGIDGFSRYVALAVLARNIKRIGAILRQQELDKEKRKRGPYKKAA